jgi:isopenicillin-N epimerase
MTHSDRALELADLTRPAVNAGLWLLDPDTVFLNHGSFGSCPRSVLEFQRTIQDHLERQPVQFFVRELEGLWDQARAAMAGFVGAKPEDVVFVPNATSGVNTVLRSLSFAAGDELLVTDHEYNACRNALEYAAERWEAKVVLVKISFPLRSSGDVLAAVLDKVTDRTRLVLVDHVTSQTGLILPVEALARELGIRGVELLVDGAHAPGMIPLRLNDLGVPYYTGNCHKWLCAPKGAAFLYVRRDRQALVRPLTISHGANSVREDRSKFLIEFGWMGTADPSAVLTVPEALRFMGALLPGGWSAIMARNRCLALAGRDCLCRVIGIEPPAPEEMIGALATVPLPPGAEAGAPRSPLYADPLQDELRHRFQVEVPVIPWPEAPQRVLRISAQLYNALPQYERLGCGLRELLNGSNRAIR